MMILQYHEIFFRLTAPRCPSMTAGAVSLKKSHDNVILSFCYVVKGQAIFLVFLFSQFFQLAFGACQTKKIS